MWFYGMVGNSQFRDPWLDEAFASYAEELVDGEPPNAGERMSGLLTISISATPERFKSM